MFPVSLSEVTFSPAERAEIAVDLKNDLGNFVALVDRSSGARLLKLNVNKRANGTVYLPFVLTSSLEIPNLSSAIRTRRFSLSMVGGRMTINGKAMDLNRIDESVHLNDLEIWEVQNTMGMNNNFHIYATHFTVLERNGSSSYVKKHTKVWYLCYLTVE